MDIVGRIEFPDPPKHFAQNCNLLIGLETIRHVLIVTSAADPEIRARCGYALGRGLQDVDEARVQLVDGLHSDAFSRQDKRRQHDAALIARESVTAINKLFNGELEMFRHDTMVFP